MKKEMVVTVDKSWGEEIWFVNSDAYCGKLFIFDRNAETSYHCHWIKRETFTALEGHATLVIEGKEYVLAPFTRSKTVEPGEKHKIIGMTAYAIILEISTHHDEADVERFSESKAGGEYDTEATA